MSLKGHLYHLISNLPSTVYLAIINQHKLLRLMNNANLNPSAETPFTWFSSSFSWDGYLQTKVGFRELQELSDIYI